MKNLVLITSVINISSSPLSYSKTRSCYTLNQRLNDTFKTISSVRTYVPDCAIFLVECSELTNNISTLLTNEVDYFRRKLSNKEQLRVMQDLKEINKHINIEKPYRLALLDSKMPAKFKATAMQKLNVLKSMEPGDPEYYKIKNWVDTFMRMPFDKRSEEHTSELQSH